MSETIVVNSLVNTHTHLREDCESELIMGPLIRNAIEGGASALLPMPNTEKGLTTAEDVVSYIEYARKWVPPGVDVTFIPTVQLTEDTTERGIGECVNLGIRDAKVYPRGRTTKSHLGVEHYGSLIGLIHYAGRNGMRIHFHPEHPSPLYQNRDAEFAFAPLIEMFLQETEAVLIWEHGTDARCIPHWLEWAKSGRFYVTLTAHHLAASEDEAYGDVQAVCKPPYKTERDREGLIRLVGEDHRWVMAGGDDAPHPRSRKHKRGPCACGAYTSPFLLPLYAHALDSMLLFKAADTFVNFTSGNAKRLYGFPETESRLITLERKPTEIPHICQIGPWEVEPFWAGRKIDWKIVE